MACSLIFQLVTPDKISYSLLPSRIWQFLVGTLCYEPRYEGYKSLEEHRALLDQEKGGEGGISANRSVHHSYINHKKSTMILVSRYVRESGSFFGF